MAERSIPKKGGKARGKLGSSYGSLGAKDGKKGGMFGSKGGHKKGQQNTGKVLNFHLSNIPG